MKNYTIDISVNPEFDEKEFKKLMCKNDAFVKINNCTTSTTNADGGWWYVNWAGNTRGTLYHSTVPFVTKEDFIPIKIIYNPPATICYFKDGTKTVVRCAEDEEYCKEEGVMACIMKKIFKSRNQFKKLVDAGYEQPPKAVNYHYKKDQWG